MVSKFCTALICLFSSVICLKVKLQGPTLPPPEDGEQVTKKVVAVAPLPDKQNLRATLSESSWYLQNHANLPPEIVREILSYLNLPIVDFASAVSGQRYLIKHPETNEVLLALIDVSEGHGKPIRVCWVTQNPFEVSRFSLRMWNKDHAPFGLRGQFLCCDAPSSHNNLLVALEKHKFELQSAILEYSPAFLRNWYSPGRTGVFVSRVNWVIDQLTNELCSPLHDVHPVGDKAFRQAAHVVAKLFTGISISDDEVNFLQNDIALYSSDSLEVKGFVRSVMENYMKYRIDLALGLSLNVIWGKKTADDVQQLLLLCLHQNETINKNFLLGFHDLDHFMHNEAIFRDLVAIASTRKLLGTDKVYAVDINDRKARKLFAKFPLHRKIHDMKSLEDSLINIRLPIKHQLARNEYTQFVGFAGLMQPVFKTAPHKGMAFFEFLQGVFSKTKRAII